jgi:hypothetical protein
VGAQAIWDRRRRWYGAAGLVVGVLALAYSGYASWTANAEHRADPREFLVTTQSSEAVADIAERLRGSDGAITVDGAEGATYPWAWYFRDMEVAYLDLSVSGEPPPSDALILTRASHERLRATLPDYAVRQFPFRVWWVRDYGAMSVQNWWNWFVHREPWNPPGGMPEWLYTRP